MIIKYLCYVIGQQNHFFHLNLAKLLLKLIIRHQQVLRLRVCFKKVLFSMPKFYFYEVLNGVSCGLKSGEEGSVFVIMVLVVSENTSHRSLMILLPASSSTLESCNLFSLRLMQASIKKTQYMISCNSWFNCSYSSLFSNRISMLQYKPINYCRICWQVSLHFTQSLLLKCTEAIWYNVNAFNDLTQSDDLRQLSKIYKIYSALNSAWIVIQQQKLASKVSDRFSRASRSSMYSYASLKPSTMQVWRSRLQ